MYPEIVEVAQTDIFDQANDLLKKGWKLLNVVQYKSEEYAYPIYVLGLPKNVSVPQK